jgi:AraC-like DNA-binding protein
MTILDVAFEVGFNSKASFNAHFLEKTGRTPSQYRKENGRNK